MTALNRKPAGPETPPAGWQREVPKYRALRDLHPSPKARHRTEPPFGMTTDSDCWQYAARAIAAGEVIETKDWPHSSFQPLNFSAAKVLEFFSDRQKSRLPLSPWFGDRVRLDDGLTGTGPTLDQIGLQPLKRVDLRSAS